MPQQIKDILTFDVVNSSVYYIKKNLPNIKNPIINVTFPERVEPQAMVVDFLTEKFYILDKRARTVNVLDFEGKNFAVVLSDLEDPHDIVLDIEQGFMFILQYKKSVIKIQANNYLLYFHTK